MVKKTMQQSISKRLKELRIKNNLTQAELADALNVGQGTVSDWESGNIWPRPQHIDALAKYYKMTQRSLLFGK